MCRSCCYSNDVWKSLLTYESMQYQREFEDPYPVDVRSPLVYLKDHFLNDVDVQIYEFLSIELIISHHDNARMRNSYSSFIDTAVKAYVFI